ncbi:uncharacterized protein LOC128999095 [Macrosteles quadrilineatus]|uniref:uncharacterized protein LOC128999095 n=1 Tax=Macrosteles quadrilineatus TaxID=74068 RepID=UPI0023E1BF0D|nr:uncharacterized protein LOC128999095 [Macrosteles quadrilineatus]
MYSECRSIFLLCSYFSTFMFVYSQKLLARHCPQVVPISDFDRDRYMGVWYQQAQFKSFLREEVMCKHVVYKPVGENGFRLEARMLARVLNGPVSIYGVAKPVRPSNDLTGEYVVTMFGEATNEDISYNILFTDYDRISIVWSCDSFYKLWSKQNIQVLTRDRKMNSTTLLASTLKTLLPQQLDHYLDLLSPIDQSECEEILPQ